MRPSRLALVLPFTFLLAGCGGDKSTSLAPPPNPMDDVPRADSPTHLIQRFEKTWEFQDESEYELLLTDDFHFNFSAASDPNLVNQYPNWGRDDEEASTKHFFDGFQNSNGVQVPAASRIDMTLTGVGYTSDPNHPDSTAQYQRIVVTTVDMTIDVPQAGSDPLQYHVNARHEFYLVRGDAAVISGGASADTAHWYLRRWDDLSQPLSGGKWPVINPARANSWGSIKAAYRS